MRCPSCQATETRVTDSRIAEEGAVIRRRRECSNCSFRFSTNERMELLNITVEKSDGAQQRYDREKIMRSLKTALRKRSVDSEKLRRTVQKIEEEIQTKAKKDVISTKMIGEIVMKHLKKLDKVAYVRFASVYRSFEDVEEFADELQKLLSRRKKKS